MKYNKEGHGKWILAPYDSDAAELIIPLDQCVSSDIHVPINTYISFEFKKGLTIEASPHYPIELDHVDGSIEKGEVVKVEGNRVTAHLTEIIYSVARL